MIKLDGVSHLDHHLTPQQIEYVLSVMRDVTGFVIQAITLPPELGTVPCALWGPAMGDRPITGDRLWGPAHGAMPPGDYVIPAGADAQTLLFKRHAEQVNQHPFTGEVALIKLGTRHYESRIINAPMRPTRTLTVIAGPYETHECVLYTCYGGPCAPREPGDFKGDPQDLAGERQRQESNDFWAVHALSKYVV